MKSIRITPIIFILLPVLIAMSVGSIPSLSRGDKTEPIYAADTCNCYSSSSFNNFVINFNNQVPGDFSSPPTQSTANCFAWQEFIALNWPSQGSKSFGQPRDFTPVMWEIYMPKNVLFQPNGVVPPKWGTLVSKAYAAKFKSQRLLVNPTKTKLLTFTAKFADVDTIAGFDPNQAAPNEGPNWLGAQNKTNVWYEVMLNKDYYNFVFQKGYYNAQVQHDSVINNHAILFPAGVYQGAVGAIELKAAWMEVDNIQSAKWDRYKLSSATVYDSTTGKLRNTTVALVGLHILHKTKIQPTWIWATFEHIDNVPGNTENAPTYGYNFYNANCVAQPVKLKNGTIATVSCAANISPPYYLSQALPVPVQVKRVNGIDPTDAVPINNRMQTSIRKYYQSSVFQYYQLIDVIWSQQVQSDSKIPIQAPFSLNSSSMTSGANTVANTTMETYVQNTKTCTSCHKFSTIAPLSSDQKNNQIFGDFSFAISAAQSATSHGLKRVKKSSIK